MAIYFGTPTSVRLTLPASITPLFSEWGGFPSALVHLQSLFLAFCSLFNTQDFLFNIYALSFLLHWHPLCQIVTSLLCMGFLSFLSVLGLHPLQVFSAMFRPPHCTWLLLKCDPVTPSLASISANITENLQMMSTSKGQRVFFSGPLLPPKIKLSHKGHKWRPAYFPLSCF